MALGRSYVVSYKRIPKLLEAIQAGQAPESLTHDLLRDMGLRSSNDRAMIPLLKSLDFLSQDGRPTSRYHRYRDRAEAPRVMAEALQETYADLFLIKSRPTEDDRKSFEGKFKSTHNVSDNLAELMTYTFFTLLGVADLDATDSQIQEEGSIDDDAEEGPSPVAIGAADEVSNGPRRGSARLHYNIQVHLPATKDVEVFNAIFKSLREHLID
jgi:hypothetical protein